MAPTPPKHTRSRWLAATDAVLADPRKVFAAAFVPILLLTAAWSLATPLFAAPDEPSQIVHAVALDRGELIGKAYQGPGSAYTEVTVPALFADGNHFPCYAFKPRVPASCARPLTSSTQPVLTTTYVGRYPPLYYALTGLPSLLTVSTTGIYLMRLVSALIGATLLALAVMTVVAWSRRSFLLVGVLLAATPMTLFLSGVVNPSGMEICAAICMWTSGLVLVAERAQHPPGGLVAVFVVATTGLVLSRGLSVLWAAMIVAFLAFVGRGGTFALLRNRSMRLPFVVIAVAAVAVIAWIVAAHSNDLVGIGYPFPKNEADSGIFLKILGHTGPWFQQMVGVFGWLDTGSPLVTFAIWYGAIGFVVVLALGVADARWVLAMVVLIAVVLLVPVAIVYAQVHRLGVDWQGRYIMPMAVGVPLLATALIDGTGILRRVRSRVSTLLCAGVGVAGFAAFFWTLRRYASGIAGPLDPVHGTWRAPFGNGVMVAWYLVGTVALVGGVALATWRLGSRGATEEPQETLGVRSFSSATDSSSTDSSATDSSATESVPLTWR